MMRSGSVDIHVEDLFYDRSHVVIFIFGKPAAEYDSCFFVCQCLVFQMQFVVPGIVYRIIRFEIFIPFDGVFSGNDGFRALSDIFAEHFEMFVFDHSGVRDILVGVVYDGISLIVRAVQFFFLEIDSPVFQFPEPVVVEFVYFPGKDYLFGYLLPMFPVFKEIGVRDDFRAVQQPFDELVVASDRNALVLVAEIIVVIYESYRKPSDDK